MRLRPISLKDANDYVSLKHRHHKPTQGHKFSIAAEDNDNIIGVVIVGRPVARGSDDGRTSEILRCCTDGTKNACSFLNSAAARASKAMGYSKIQTYTLSSEDGASLKASGFRPDGLVKGRDWNTPSRLGRRTDQPMVDKIRWVKEL